MSGDASQPAPDGLPYGSAYHVPVLCHAAVTGLVHERTGVYVDGTLGGGGHSAALLDALESAGRVIGVDQDEDALAVAEERLASAVVVGRFQTIRGNFGNLPALLHDRGIERVDGLLLDLGVSSYQLDTATRGFSYSADGVLDMRMDQASERTAHEIVNTWDEYEIRRVLYAYGEEKRAPKVARAIVQARPLETTTDLTDLVRGIAPAKEVVKTLARVFQALRIAVNGELEVLEQILLDAPRLLKPGGRMAVISYHSLEDRRVKRIFQTGNLKGERVRDLYGNQQTPWRLITRKPIRADETEIAANPRARSARLRIAERIA